MNKRMVIFRNIEEIITFIEKVEKYPYSMNMKCGECIVDAKSLLGIINLGFSREIELEVCVDECDDLWHDIEEFVAA